MITNASPLIVNAKLEILKEVSKLYPILEITEWVYQEAVLNGLESERQDAVMIETLYKKGCIKIIKLNKKHQDLAEHIQENYKLDRGEAETIALALQKDVKEILMDEAIGRRVAIFFNLRPKGSLRVLLELYKKKYLDEEQLKNKVNELIGSQFRLDAQVLAHFWDLFERIKK